MNVILGPLFGIIDIVLHLYTWVVIVWVVLSWLISFNVVNTTNSVVYQISRALYALTEPALAPMRRVVPNFGGIDVTPVLLLLIILFVRDVLRRLAFEIGVI